MYHIRAFKEPLNLCSTLTNARVFTTYHLLPLKLSPVYILSAKCLTSAYNNININNLFVLNKFKLCLSLTVYNPKYL
jgi:hypothetical protein